MRVSSKDTYPYRMSQSNLLKRFNKSVSFLSPSIPSLVTVSYFLMMFRRPNHLQLAYMLGIPMIIQVIKDLNSSIKSVEKVTEHAHASQ